MTTESSGASGASTTTTTTAAPAPGGAPATTSAAPAVASIGEAPAPAPAAAPAPAPVTPGTAFTYSQTGDAGLDMALGFVGNLGFGPEHAAIVAAQNGDFAPLKAELGRLGDKSKGWENYVALAERAHADGQAKANAKNAETLKTVHEAVGGEDNWKVVSQWANENAEPHEREAINGALKLGGMAAKAIAQYLAGLHSGAPGIVREPAAVAAPAAKGKSAPESGAISSVEYATQVQSLREKLGYSFDQSSEYKQLQQRRFAGQRRGMA